MLSIVSIKFTLVRIQNLFKMVMWPHRCHMTSLIQRPSYWKHHQVRFCSPPQSCMLNRCLFLNTIEIILGNGVSWNIFYSSNLYINLVNLIDTLANSWWFHLGCVKIKIQLSYDIDTKLFYFGGFFVLFCFFTKYVIFTNFYKYELNF